VQILRPQPESDIKTFSNETGDYIEGFLISTKYNRRDWRVKPPVDKLTEILQREVPNKHIMIDGAKLEAGLDSHYYGDDTPADILKGYHDKSHAIYQKVLGPYPYNDGTDDVYYRFIGKLNHSQAAAELIKYGEKMWHPFAISPHIYPLEGPKDNITNFQFMGGALVLRGAYGEEAVISKMCKGTEAVCTKSLGGATNNEDEKTAQIISSLVSKTASDSLYMAENSPTTADVTKAPVNVQPSTPTISPQAPVSETKSIESQTVIQNPILMNEDQRKKMIADAVEEERKKWQGEVTKLVDKDKTNTLIAVFAKVQDEKIKKDLIEKYKKYENVEQFREFLDDISPHLSVTLPVDTGNVKSKGASDAGLPREPSLPKIETSQAAAAPSPTMTNKPATLINFVLGKGRLV
jgi:hypothetical protein